MTSLSSVALFPVDRTAAITWLRFAFVKTSGMPQIYVGGWSKTRENCERMRTTENVSTIALLVAG